MTQIFYVLRHKASIQHRICNKKNKRLTINTAYAVVQISGQHPAV